MLILFSLVLNFQLIRFIGFDFNGTCWVQEKTVPEEQNASIQEDSWENIERHQELHAGMSQKTIPKSRELVFAYKQVRSIVSKAPLSSRTKIWCYTTMLRVAVVAVVFLMSVFTWRFLKVES